MGDNMKTHRTVIAASLAAAFFIPPAGLPTTFSRWS
jgi:hypothetical protein